MGEAKAGWRTLLKFGERRHSSFASARRWLLNEMPRYEAESRYVLFKPLSKADPQDNIRAVVFPLSPLELSGLVTLLASVVEGVDPIQVPPGADCFRIAGYACAQKSADSPRAVLGMLDVDGREVMHRRFRSDIVTLTMPMSLFGRLEEEANNSVLQIPAWLKLRSKP
jgi:hypothetical protein